MANDTPIDLSLLDKNVSDIEDLPSFAVPSKGTYALLVSAGTKMVNEHPAAVFDINVVQCLEKLNPSDPDSKEGDKFGLMFMLDNEFGMGNMKKFILPFAQHFSTDNLRTLITEKIQNVVITALVDHRPDKDDKTKIYPVLKNIKVQ